MTETKDGGAESPAMIDSKELAEILRVAPRTLETWRYRRTGPKFVRIGKRMVRYRLSDIREFLENRRVDPDCGEDDA